MFFLSYITLINPFETCIVYVCLQFLSSPFLLLPFKLPAVIALYSWSRGIFKMTLQYLMLLKMEYLAT